MPIYPKAGLVPKDATPQIEQRFLSRPAAAPSLLAEIRKLVAWKDSDEKD